MSARVSCAAIGASLCLGAIALPAEALDHGYRTWAAVTASGKLGEGFGLHLHVVGRFYDFEDEFHPHQLRIQPAFWLEIADGMKAYLGYAWAPSWSSDHDFTDEHRVWEQWSWELPELPFQLRTRFEQRIRPSADDSFGLRLRQKIEANLPIAGELEVVISEELFLGLNDAATAADRVWQRFGIDENRAFLGLGYGITDAVRVEGGYLNRWSYSIESELQHALSLAVEVKLE